MLEKLSLLIITVIIAVCTHQVVQVRNDFMYRKTLIPAQPVTGQFQEPDTLSRVEAFLVLQQLEPVRITSSLKAVSDPLSGEYRNFKSVQHWGDLVKPNYMDRQGVVRWLRTGEVEFTDRGDHLHLRGTVGSFNALFNTKLLLDGYRLVNYHDITIPRSVTAVEALVGLVTVPGSRAEAPPSAGVDNRVLHAALGYPGTFTVQQRQKCRDIPNVATIEPSHATLTVSGVPNVTNINITVVSEHGWCGVLEGLLRFGITYTDTDCMPSILVLPEYWNERLECGKRVTCRTGLTDVGTGMDPYWLVERTNIELAKLALAGVTVIAASPSELLSSTDMVCGAAMFPASSPWVVSVGDVSAAYAQASTGVVHLESLSRGGFSWISDRPWYQPTAVSSYLDTAVGLPPTYTYNGAGRAYPDIVVPGTGDMSAAMVFARALSHQVSQLGRMGFINPVLYMHAGTGGDSSQSYMDSVRSIKENLYDCYPESDAQWTPHRGLGTPHNTVLAAWLTSAVKRS